MKKFTFTLVASLVIVMLAGFVIESVAAEKPRIGVLRFTNKTSAGWWSGGVGRDLQDMLINELASTDAFRVLERKELDAVLSEQDLGASGRISKGTRAKVGNVTGAKYLVAATVSSFEKGTEGQGGGLSFRGFSIGGDREKAYIAVDLKVIEVETGEIKTARTIEATSKSSGINLGLHKWGFGGNLSEQSKTPTGKAIRACIIEIAGYLDCALNKGRDSACMEEYSAKETKRREKTKGSIDLE